MPWYFLSWVLGSDIYLYQETLYRSESCKRKFRRTSPCGHSSSSNISSTQKQLKTDCEIIWVKLDIVASKPLYIAAYYRPKKSDAKSLEELNKSLEMVSMRKGSMWVLGDFNFPGLSWNSEHIPKINPGCRYPTLYNDFISCLEDHSLVQMVSKPTRDDNVLDLFLTSNHTLVNKVEIFPGISDHEISISSVSLKPKITRQKPRSVPIYRKADWESFNPTWPLKHQKFWIASKKVLLRKSGML